MKTIEERAKEWGEHIVETTPYDVVNGKACVFVEDRNIADVAEESYIAGATEQKAIDEEECAKYVLDEIGDFESMTMNEIVYAIVRKVFEYSKKEKL